ncbi:hypothetical protein [Emticicia sp. SJ17W-69]|uniref:hypothetical protein n=1 Tax=Emticicia sp. SJ17W-69 TaxID=3421657 RepID=UPI003EC1370D
MKNSILTYLILIVVWGGNTYAQSNTMTPQGIMFPQLTTAQIGAIYGQTKGMMVFDKELNLIKYWDGAIWQTMNNGGSGGAWQTYGSDQYSTNIGNIGIGTQSPDTKLHVVHPGGAGVKISAADGSRNSSFLDLQADGNGYSGVRLYNNNFFKWAIYNDSERLLFVNYYGVNAMIVSGQNDGIILPLGLKVNESGVLIKDIRFGILAIGSSTNNSYSQPITFQNPMPNANYTVTLTQNSLTNDDDFFQMQVRNKTASGFTVWVKRRDANTGWGQNLQVSWIAIAGQ